MNKLFVYDEAEASRGGIQYMLLPERPVVIP